ncbi:MAG: SEC-C domain-containing protein [Acidobacteriia bacterium]|nr:SEC-C domain-containing protein [Terriglobia bacterium]
MPVAVASPQKPNDRFIRQLGGGPQSFTRQGFPADRVNQTNQIPVAWHCGDLSAHGRHGESKSAVYHEIRLANYAKKIDHFSSNGSCASSTVSHLRGTPQEETVHSNAQRPAKTGRNEPCPCGSGLKFKRCGIDRSTLGKAICVHSRPFAAQFSSSLPVEQQQY